MIIGQINLRMWTRQGHRHRVVMAFSLSGAGTSHGRAIAYKGQPRGGRRATTGREEGNHWGLPLRAS